VNAKPHHRLVSGVFRSSGFIVILRHLRLQFSSSTPIFFFFFFFFHFKITTMSTSSTPSELPLEVIACLKNARYVSFFLTVCLLTAGLSNHIFPTAPFGDLRWSLASCKDNSSCFYYPTAIDYLNRFLS